MDNRKLDICAIFFDLDNTLVKTRKADEETCKELMEILIKQYSVSSEVAKLICNKFLNTFRKCPENSLTDLHEWRKYVWRTALGQSYAHLTDDIYKLWLDMRYNFMSLTLETRNLLSKLSAKYLLAIITNGPSKAQWEKVNKLNIRPYFDLILVSGDLPWEKPHSNIFIKACNKLNIEPHQAVMIGDKLETDILGSINSNLCASIWLPFGGEKLNGNGPIPDFIINDITELESLLLQIHKMKAVLVYS
ncbi:N-acylneuraminate-9-phosphatase isoform X1 [Diorhabda sublineata]|uniref:N-acylneuraminate-9-phosphatase isoform X1 n=1 Tax=Diorhabda sublineata TaxID=1163346 RepID=UPI0024E0AEF9|nr:N-acylneuraminate-9-phosphatase isoform X1 [Diorhabda sublineata]